MGSSDAPDFIVLGAGPAGLMFAKTATEQGRRVLVLEGAKVAGGMSKSISFAGGTVDLGPHAIGTGLPRVREIFDSVLGGEFDRFQLRTGMLWDGQVYSYPPTLSELLKQRGMRYCLRAAASLCLGRMSPGLRKPVSCIETSAKCYGRVLVDDCLRPYLLRLWGDELDRVHPSWKPGRFNTGGVLSWISHLIRGTGDVRILHPTRGMGDLYTRLAEHIQSMGCVVETCQRVERIAHDGERIECLVVRDARADQAREIDCRHSAVVSTLPVPALLGILDPELPWDPHSTESSLEFRNTIVCYFAADEASVPARHILYLNDQSFHSGRFTNYNMWGKSMRPTADGRAIISFEFWLATDEFSNARDERLIAAARADAQRLGIRIQTQAEPRVVRIPRSHPVLTNESENAMRALNQRLSCFGNIHLTGRAGSFTYADQDVILNRACELALELTRDHQRSSTDQ